jgi:hypothetical protein
MNALTHSVLHALHTRKWRRRLVAGTYLGYLLFIASWSYPPVAAPWFLLVKLPVFALLVASYLGLHHVTRDTAARKAGPLDEREQQVRGDAYRTAYRIIAGLSFLLVAWTLVAMDYPDLFLRPRLNDLLSEALVFLVLFTVTLPTCVVAWTEPDLEDVDPQEEPADWMPAAVTTLHAVRGVR